LSGAEGRRRSGVFGLCGLALAAIPLAAPGPGLVPAATSGGPGWLLGLFGGGLGVSPGLYYGLLWVAFASYLLVLRAAPVIPGRLLWGSIAALLTLFVLAPPLLSQDVFSYISYARLGAGHHLNPYVHVPAELPADPAYPHVGWTDSVSAYGPAFTLLTYPLGLLSVPAALWTLKALSGLSVLALAALCARLAGARGLDGRTAAAFVALNPLVLVHVVGGAHNDGLMMLAVLLGCAAVLSVREAAGGGAFALAVAVKLSAAFAAPYALAGSLRRGRFLAAFAGALALLTALSLAAFGGEFLDSFEIAGENQARISNYSVPNSLAELFGLGSDPLRHAMLALFLLAAAALLVWAWRGADWVRATGWAALGLLLASAWLLPWYAIWVLPLAALARDRALSGLVLAFTAFQLINRVPL